MQLLGEDASVKFYSCVACAAAVLAFCNATYGSIAIVNPGFESPTTNTTLGGAPTGWTLSGPGGAGVWDINTFPAGFWTGASPAPEGDQVAYLSDAPAPGAPSTISQFLADTLQANTLYNLSGQVGHPIGFGTTPVVDTVYTVELFAGANFLAATSGTGPEGSFIPFLVPFDSTGSAFVGQLLQIRLSSSQAQTAYDAIELAANGAVPEPSSVAVWFGIGAICTAGAWLKARRPW